MKSISIIRVSIGIIYLWFGILKFFPNISPAETIAKRTVDILTFGLFPTETNYMILAFFETLLGLLLVGNIWKRMIMPIALVHILMTFSPMFLFPAEVFEKAFVPTLLGQYIIKNIVLFTALLLVNKDFYCEEVKRRTSGS